MYVELSPTVYEVCITCENCVLHPALSSVSVLNMRIRTVDVVFDDA